MKRWVGGAEDNSIPLGPSSADGLDEAKPNNDDDDDDDDGFQTQGHRPVRERGVLKNFEIRLRFSSIEAVHASQTFSLARDGCFLCMYNPCGRGTTVRLFLEIGEHELQIQGLVVDVVDKSWARKSGVSISFLRMRAEDEAFLASELPDEQQGSA